MAAITKKATRKTRAVSFRLNDGSVVTVKLKFSFDAATLPAEKQTQLWDAIGQLLAVAIPEEDRPEFVTQLHAERDRLLAEVARNKGQF